MGNKMMNEDRDIPIESMAKAWTIETTDLSLRVAAAIGAASTDPMADLLHEVRALRRDMDALRQSNATLQNEVTRLRHDLTSRKAVRIAPYASVDNLVRLS